MAKLEKFLLQSYDKPAEPDLSITLPTGSIPKKISSYPDGMYLWAEVPSIEVMSSETFRFHNLMKDAEIPSNSEYFTTLEIFEEIDTPEGPRVGVMVQHIYKYK